MSITKKAKTLAEKQVKLVLTHLALTRDAQRNAVIFLLSVDAGLRTKEIASVEWKMVLDAHSQLTDAIRLEDKSAKGKSGGVAFISNRSAAALADYADGRDLTGTIVKSRNGKAI